MQELGNNVERAQHYLILCVRVCGQGWGVGGGGVIFSRTKCAPLKGCDCDILCVCVCRRKLMCFKICPKEQTVPAGECLYGLTAVY